MDFHISPLVVTKFLSQKRTCQPCSIRICPPCLDVRAEHYKEDFCRANRYDIGIWKTHNQYNRVLVECQVLD